MTDAPAPSAAPTRLLVEMLVELRPRLHRYAARMAGSTADGDDIVQETFVKVLKSPPDIDNFTMLERWLVRVAHNTAIDFMRARARLAAVHAAEEPDMIIDTAAPIDPANAAVVSLRRFMRLPPLQRSVVIFKDVLGYSLDEVVQFTGSTIPAVKSALQRGRARLQQLAKEPEDAPLPALAADERRLLFAYAERFNARDFDAVRAMLADEVKLNLVNRVQADGKPRVSQYFGNYDKLGGWRLAPGLVDRRPALLALDPDDPHGTPLYFMLLEWVESQVTSIRDFRYARYALEGAEIVVLEGSQP
jgi:RNA polymerase sigma-70 factor (ECF subfamily)